MSVCECKLVITVLSFHNSYWLLVIGVRINLPRNTHAAFKRAQKDSHIFVYSHKYTNSFSAEVNSHLMASPQPHSQEHSPKVYLRNEMYSPSVPESAYSIPYTKTQVVYKPGEAVIYTRQPANMSQHQYKNNETPTEQPYYMDDSTMRSGTFSEASNDSRSRNSKSAQRTRPRHHHHHYLHRRPKIEDPDGYWQVPHNSQPTTSGPYITPGGRQLSRTPKKHTAGIQVEGKDQVIGMDPGASYGDITQELEEYMQGSQYLPSEDSELTVSV